MGALSNLSAVAAPPRPEKGLLGDLWTVVLAIMVVVGELVLLIAIWEPAHWQPYSLVAVLTAFMVLGEVHAVRIGRVYVSSTACASLLAMALLGPVPAAVITGVGCAADWAVNRKVAWAGLSNTANGSLAVLAGALLVELAGDGTGGRFALVVFLAGILNAAVNLLLLTAVRRIRLGASFRYDFAGAILPTIPYHLLGITLGTGAAQIVVAGDFPLLAAVIPALVVSEFLLRSLAAEHSRAEEVITLTSERANLLDQALNAEVAEREWIAGHLHDETLQTLAVARQDIEESVSGDRSAALAARDHLDAAVRQLRSTLVHVHPGSVGERGLGPTLDVYAGQALRRNGTTWRIDVEPRAGEMHEALLYSLARELLGNAAKHAHAGHVDLRIALDGDVVRLTVADDGAGFDRAPFDTPDHFGLLTARHRVAAAGGTLTVSSEPGEGATIVAELPARVADQRSR